jgi:hypothetical protein
VHHHFPATVAALNGLTSGELNDLLDHFGLPLRGALGVRRARFTSYIIGV